MLTTTQQRQDEEFDAAITQQNKTVADVDEVINATLETSPELLITHLRGTSPSHIENWMNARALVRDIAKEPDPQVRMDRTLAHFTGLRQETHQIFLRAIKRKQG